MKYVLFLVLSIFMFSVKRFSEKCEVALVLICGDAGWRAIFTVHSHIYLVILSENENIRKIYFFPQ